MGRFQFRVQLNSVLARSYTTSIRAREFCIAWSSLLINCHDYVWQSVRSRCYKKMYLASNPSCPCPPQWPSFAILSWPELHRWNTQREKQFQLFCQLVRARPFNVRRICWWISKVVRIHHLIISEQRELYSLLSRKVKQKKSNYVSLLVECVIKLWILLWEIATRPRSRKTGISFTPVQTFSRIRREGAFTTFLRH